VAGEWLPVDIALGTKPEVQELVDLSGQGVEVVVYRLLQLWGWVSLNSADGTVRATPERLARICGGDAAFWRQVEAVGWVDYDSDAGTAVIPGWGRRFSMAAKARQCGNDRVKRWRNGDVTVDRYKSVTTGEDRTESSSSARDAAQPKPAAGTGDCWEALVAAWNEKHPPGNDQRWRSPKPPKGAAERLAEAGWLERAREAIGLLPRLRYFATPVTLQQLCHEGFVDRALGGQYDNPKPTKATRFPEDKPPAAGFQGDDAARFEATRRRELAKLKAAEVA
jgi:hypothetical protein